MGAETEKGKQVIVSALASFSGKSDVEIARITDLNRATVSKIRRKYENGSSDKDFQQAVNLVKDRLVGQLLMQCDSLNEKIADGLADESIKATSVQSLKELVISQGITVQRLMDVQSGGQNGGQNNSINLYINSDPAEKPIEVHPSEARNLATDNIRRRSQQNPNGLSVTSPPDQQNS